MRAMLPMETSRCARQRAEVSTSDPSEPLSNNQPCVGVNRIDGHDQRLSDRPLEGQVAGGCGLHHQCAIPVPVPAQKALPILTRAVKSLFGMYKHKLESENRANYLLVASEAKYLGIPPEPPGKMLIHSI